MSKPNLAASLIAALLTIAERLNTIEQRVTDAQPLAVHETPTAEAADVVLVPTDWGVRLDGTHIGTVIFHSYGERPWHALWWTGAGDDRMQHSEMYPTREAAIEAMVKAYRAQVEAVAA